MPRGRFPDINWFLMEAGVNWLLLRSMMLVSFLIGISLRIFAVSLPTIARNLETDIVGISLALNSYTVATIGLSLVFGRLGDLYGRWRVYGVGLTIFTVTSLLCGLAQDVFQLVFFRLLQGIGAAMVETQGRVLAMEAAPQSMAGKTQGLINTAYQLGFLLGPTLGGLIIDYIHWRGVFFFLVPLGAAAAALARINQRRSQTGSSPAAIPRASIDYLGAFLLVVVAVALIAILDPRLIAIIGAGWQIGFVILLGALFVGFVIREATASSPILDLSLFGIRQFTLSAISLLLVSITQSLSLFLLPFYIQEILLFSPTLMGLLFMTMPIFGVALSPLGGFLSDRVGPRMPSTVGVIFYSVATLLGALLQTDSQWLLPTIMLGLAGFGSAFFYPPNSAAMLSSVPQVHRGVAAGTIYMIFGLGNMLGISLGTFLMTTFFRLHTGISGAAPTTAEPTGFVAAMNTTFLATTVLSFIAAACSIARGKNPA